MASHQPLLGHEDSPEENTFDITVGSIDLSSSDLPPPLPPQTHPNLLPFPSPPNPTSTLQPQPFSTPPTAPLPPPLSDFTYTTPMPPPPQFPNFASSLPPPLSIPSPSPSPSPLVPFQSSPSRISPYETIDSQGGSQKGTPLPPLPDYLLSGGGVPSSSSLPFTPPNESSVSTSTLSTIEREKEKGKLHEAIEEKNLSTVERKRMKERRTTITRTYERTKEREAKQKQRSANRKELLWAQMEELKTLYEQGFLTEQEFEERKSQVIDELTGTKKGGSSSRTPKKRKKKTVHHDDGIEQPSRPPPDFTEIQPEEAIKHIFDPHVRSWSQHPCQVRLDSEPFAKGTLRKAYYLQVFIFIFIFYFLFFFFFFFFFGGGGGGGEYVCERERKNILYVFFIRWKNLGKELSLFR